MLDSTPWEKMKYSTLENTEYSILEYVVINKLQKSQIIPFWNIPLELTQKLGLQ